MMASPSVAIDKFKDEELLLHGGPRTHRDSEQSFTPGDLRLSGSTTPTQDQKPMDVDKSSIYRHPLFPLLALLFEKCEQSTRGSDCVTSASFDLDIETFVRGQEKEGKAFFSDDPDVDSLMVKAIQVLRIHLLELEKVSDLCKDFCSRYIACLKSKMNSENLLSGEPGSPYSPIPSETSSSFTGTLSPQRIMLPVAALQQGNLTVTTANPTPVVAGMSQWHTATTGGTVYQPVTVVTPQGQLVTQALSPGALRIPNTQLQLQLSQDLGFFSHEDSSSKSKRGVLPKVATAVMRSWLFQHIGHPYPTEDEKKQIATQTNLTLLQVNNWFINARRRILQPMLDANAAEPPKSKKKAAQGRPLQRFWPNSVVSTISQQQVTMADGTTVTVGMSVDGLQSLSSQRATLAVQEVLAGAHSEDESGDSGSTGDSDEDGMAGLGLHTGHSL